VLEDRWLLSTFLVTNSNDSGLGSLRQAILDANATPNTPNTIAFTPGVNSPISLLSALPALDNNVTLTAGPAGPVTVQRSSAAGTPDFRVFTVNAGRTVAIDGLAIANGQVTGDSGGGILNLGTLDLRDSVVTGNTSLRDSHRAGGRGGGIQNSGTLTLEKSLVTGNTATVNGGGIANGTATTAGTLSVEGSQITGNSANVGGGLEIAGGTATVDGSLVAGNTGQGDGAGIRSERGTTLTITSSAISDNTSGPFGTGGLASGATLTVRNTLVSGNSSAAAGVYVFGSANVLISHSFIRDNVANNPGFSAGGLWSRSTGTVRVEDTTISGNTGGFAGGVFQDVVFSGELDVVDSIITGNTGTGSFFGSGGMLRFGYNTVRIEDSTISGNLGNAVGGMSEESNGDSQIIDSTVSGNVGGRAGGVEGRFVTQFDIVRSTISGNTAIPTGPSDGLCAGGVLGVAHIDNSTISGNTVLAGGLQDYYGFPGGAAGGVLALPSFGSTSTTIDHSTIAFNKVLDAPSGDFRISGGVTGWDYSPAYPANVGVRNTIIAQNVYNLTDPDVTGSFQSQGHNLVGVLGASATGFVASDLHGSATAPLLPRLAPLGYYGGPTQTHALLPDSPAINAGDNSNAPPTDQRGDPRIVGGIIDIGSFEASSPVVPFMPAAGNLDTGPPVTAAILANTPAGPRPADPLVRGTTSTTLIGLPPGPMTGAGDSGTPLLAAPDATTLPQGDSPGQTAALPAAPGNTSLTPLARRNRGYKLAWDGNLDPGESLSLAPDSPVTQGGP
jgi:hypothetical protein